MAEVAELALYKKLLYTAEEVDQRIDEMAADIVAKYDSKTTMFVGLLNGAMPFQSKLMFAIAKHDPTFHPNAQSMIVSRYGENREPGTLRLVTDLPQKYRDLTGQTIVLLDDLIDEGDTLEFATKHLLSYGATAVDPVVLAKKKKDAAIVADRAIHKNIIYGFEAPDVWLTGMGMDDTRLTQESGRSGDGGNRWAAWIAEANTN